jgi:hypothetical protein
MADVSNGVGQNQAAARPSQEPSLIWRILHRSRFTVTGFTIEVPPPPHSNCTKKSIGLTSLKKKALSSAL